MRNRNRPTLILIDEIFNYVGSAAGVAVGNSDLAAQTIFFMQRLNGQLGSLPNTCLVISLSDKADVLDIEAGSTAKIQNEYYEKLRNITGRHRQLVTVSEYNDISHIIRRRLFSTKEDTIQYAAKDTIHWCIDAMKSGGSLAGDDIKEYTERFGNTYPFTPDVIDVLHKRWGSYSEFQRTRGVLRLLSLVVHSMLGSDRAWIAPGDIDLSKSDIRKELLQYTGDNAESVIAADIAGPDALSKREGEVGVRCASGIFMYSFPPRVGGATYMEVKRSAFTHNISHSVVGDVTGNLLRRCYYLDQTDDNMLKFDVKPNLNHIIDQATRNVPDVQVREAERKLLDASVGGSMFADVLVWPDETEASVIQDRAVLQLVICKKENPEWCAKVVNGAERTRRINMNGLIFLLPSDGILLGDLLRQYLGLQAVQRHMAKTTEYTTAVRSRIVSEVSRAKQAMGDAVRKKYSLVYIPEKGGVAKIRDYLFNPNTDSGKTLDYLLWDRLVSEDQIAVKIAPDTVTKYGEDADKAYNTMIRTPGNVMPASLEVVREAFKKAQPKSPEPKSPEPKSPEPKSPEPKSPEPKSPEPEVVYERMLYTDVVDASGLDTVRSLLLEPRGLKLTVFECSTKLRPDGKYDVRLDMKGDIPDRIVSSLKFTGRGHVEADGGWEE